MEKAARVLPSFSEGEKQLNSIDRSNYQGLGELWTRGPVRDPRGSSLDWAFLDSLLEEGISWEAISEGVRQTFKRFIPAPGRAQIKSLSYCVPEILKAAQLEAESRR